VICISCSRQFQLPGKCPECGWDADRLLAPGEACEPGHILSARYTIEESLGGGRFGVCFRARDSRLNADVVLKFIHPAFLPGKKQKKRFADAMEKLQNNRSAMLTRVHDVGASGELSFVVNEFLTGVSLLELMRNRELTRRSFAVNEIYPVMRQLAGFCVESNAGVHGTICPRNVFILPGNLKVMDCGLASALPPDAVAYRLGASERSRRYVAPEILAGQDTGPCSDVYSLGVILGEMLTQKAFDGRPEMFAQVDPDLPPDLDEVLRCALARNRRDRYADAEVFLHALCDVAGLPLPVFVKPPTDSKAPPPDDGIVQAERTAQIIMSDVISQHYEEVTAIRRMPAPPVPSKVIRPPAPVPARVEDPVVPDREGTQEIDLDELSGVREVTQTVSLDDLEEQEPSTVNEAVDRLRQSEQSAAEMSTQELLRHSARLDGVNPRFVRAAFALETEKKSGISKDGIARVQQFGEQLDGIDPRFIRAAARLENAKLGVVPVSDVEEPGETDDWRSRISQETGGKEDSVVSFLSPSPSVTEDSTVQGFPRRPGGMEDGEVRPVRQTKPAPPPPPIPRRRF